MNTSKNTVKTTLTAVEKAKATKAHNALIKQCESDLETIKKAIQVRIDAHGHHCRDLDIAKKFFDQENAVQVLIKCAELNFDYSRFVQNLHITEKATANYIAVKVIVKIQCLLQAVSGNAHKLDGYTKAVLFNCAKGLRDLNNFELMRTMTMQLITSDTMRNSERKIHNRKSSGSSTASTQTSSSRMCLLYLNIAETEKGKKDAILHILENEDNGKAFLDLAKKLFKEFSDDQELSEIAQLESA